VIAVAIAGTTTPTWERTPWRATQRAAKTTAWLTTATARR
jgi:hypothetical protein